MKATCRWWDKNFLNVWTTDTIEVLKQPVLKNIKTPIQVMHIHTSVEANMSEVGTASKKLFDGRLTEGPI